MLLLAILIVIFAAGATRMLAPVARRAQLHLRLQRDWWTPFEREFRAYASQAWESARDAERSA